ncbi:MAG TPA: hypothetical protein VJ904_09520 [Tichowtungia sp.]|nr:hypothetical protein [Tichowtungia sp.]
MVSQKLRYRNPAQIDRQNEKEQKYYKKTGKKTASAYAHRRPDGRPSQLTEFFARQLKQFENLTLHSRRNVFSAMIGNRKGGYIVRKEHVRTFFSEPLYSPALSAAFQPLCIYTA